MIEWFLSPKDDNERAIAYAMKLYGANKAADTVLDRYLGAGDRDLDRKLKTLQVRDLASRQGLNADKFMDDDANEMNRTAQGAVSYGAKSATPRKAAAAQAFAREPFSLPQAKTVVQAQMANVGMESPGFFFKEAMRDLRAVAGSATIGNRAKAILRVASVL